MDDTTPRRRRFPRIPAGHAVLVRKVGDEAFEELTRTDNVGLGGCMISSREAFGVGSLLQLLITIRLHVVDCLARVVYRNAKADGGFDVGAEFVYLAEGDQRRIAALFAGRADVAEDGYGR